MRRFSKLKKRIESLFAPDLDLKVYCTVSSYNTTHWAWDNPRFWIVLNDEVIFDWLKDFKDVRFPDPVYRGGRPVFYSNIMYVNNMIEEYIDTPTNKLFDHVLHEDCYGLSDILKAADRRIGKQRLIFMRDRTGNESAKKIIDMRLSNKNTEVNSI